MVSGVKDYSCPGVVRIEWCVSGQLIIYLLATLVRLRSGEAEQYGRWHQDNIWHTTTYKRSRIMLTKIPKYFYISVIFLVEITTAVRDIRITEQ